MTAPIALQLYTVREALGQDFKGTVEKVAAMGYAGVETAGFPGTTPAEAGRLFRELGLAVAGAHAPLPLGENKDEVLETMASLGAGRLICPAMGAEHYESADSIRRVADIFNEANSVAQANGLTFGIHNHWWEFEPVDGRTRFDVLLEHLEPEIFFEIDTYWVKTAGPDPVKVIERLGQRAPLLHIKDGPAVQKEPQVGLGKGVMDVPAIVEAAAGSAEWLIVELDHCATDMMAAVEASYRYLVENDLGRGRDKVTG